MDIAEPSDLPVSKQIVSSMVAEALIPPQPLRHKDVERLLRETAKRSSPDGGSQGSDVTDFAYSEPSGTVGSDNMMSGGAVDRRRTSGS